MAPASRKSTLNLGIEVERASYVPGDTIVGTVHRVSAVVCPEATVTVALHGRTKSKMVVSNGNSSHTYRGRFALLHLGQQVFKGPMHIPERNWERHAWPFAITIPAAIDARPFSRAGAPDPRESYIPVDPESVSRMALPASFLAMHGRKEGFVEYYLEATIRYQRKGSWSTEDAFLPVKVLPNNPEPPIVDYKLLQRRYPSSVTTQRLIPGMEQAELSKKDKMKKFFGSSSVPRLNFHLEAGVPTVLQLEHAPVPFSMRVVPAWATTSEVVQNVPQKVSLVSFRATLKAYCEIRCEGLWSPHEADWKDELDLPHDRLLSIDVPCAMEAGSKETPAADIGGAIGLRLPAGAFHSFTTFNVRLAHRLEWTARCEIAGEAFNTRGSERVVVLPASNGGFGGQQVQPPGPQRTESWIVPPDEGVPPPSFEEAQREDEKAGVLAGPSTKAAEEAEGSGKAGAGPSDGHHIDATAVNDKA